MSSDEVRKLSVNEQMELVKKILTNLRHAKKFAMHFRAYTPHKNIARKAALTITKIEEAALWIDNVSEDL